MDEKLARAGKQGDKKTDAEPSEFITGLLTFVVFVIFMTVWMYFGLKD